jgi:L-ascorbate metabolism protein UlaG (beta-lactamase superfamily)
MTTAEGSAARPGTPGAAVIVRLTGGPTALTGIGGLQLLTDPTFDPPGDHPVGSRTLVRTHGPAVGAGDPGPVDAVLLSHDQHPDNLDASGRQLLGRVPVTGFVLSGEGVPTVYISGDNASLDAVRQIGDRRGPVDIALLFAGAARTPLLDANLTLGSGQAAEAARILGARTVIPLHTEGWQHFTEGPTTITEAFARSGQQGQLILLAPGEAAELP